MIDPRDIKEIAVIKNGDSGAFAGMVNAKMQEGWTVFPDSYQYDHGLFTIMLGLVVEVGNGESTLRETLDTEL